MSDPRVNSPPSGDSVIRRILAAVRQRGLAGAISKTIGHFRAKYLDWFVFVDYGSGAGKAVLLASAYPFRRMIGVELSESLCQTAQENIARFRPRRLEQRVKVFRGDAAAFVPPCEPTVFFFYNPFGGGLMEAVIARIEASLQEAPRPAWIVYCNPECAQVIATGGVFEQVAAGRRFKVFRATKEEATRA